MSIVAHLHAPVPRKIYRLHDGTLGTEYEALRDTLRILQTKRNFLDERIEEVQRKMERAEGFTP